jgi:hypothetical protein
MYYSLPWYSHPRTSRYPADKTISLFLTHLRQHKAGRLSRWTWPLPCWHFQDFRSRLGQAGWVKYLKFEAAQEPGTGGYIGRCCSAACSSCFYHSFLDNKYSTSSLLQALSGIFELELWRLIAALASVIVYHCLAGNFPVRAF